MEYQTEIEVTEFSNQELYHHVSELSAQLGGIRLRYFRDYRGDVVYSPHASSRRGLSQQFPPWPGEYHRSCYHDEPYECFGKKVPYARPKATYRALTHFTITACKSSCLGKNTVICIRELMKSGRKFLTIHIAGECPYTNYMKRSSHGGK